DDRGRIAHMDPVAQRKIDAKEPRWFATWRTIRFYLKITPFGHVGLFPEQISNWDEVQQYALEHKSPRALNLFAYTGGTTLALAAAGAQCVHVDASEPAVSWARLNCGASGGTDWPIRWIRDDARIFVQREIRRQRDYHIIALDPPSFGHGPRGTRWQIEADLPNLLEGVARLIAPEGGLVVLSGHSSNPSAAEQAAWLEKALHEAGRKAVSPIRPERLAVDAEFGNRRLDAGYTINVRVSKV
ncbi:MAG TPA: hypothetical protein DDW52_03455, partial [Planctomycetaceae bacterium]|nr:hypothetical protein [Planctomycetaceae bacterium]